MRTPGSFVLEDIKALAKVCSDRPKVTATRLEALRVAKPTLSEDADNDPRFRNKYVIILHQAMRTKIGYTMRNPQGGSGGSSASSQGSAIAAAMRLTDEALRYIRDHQHGEVEVYWSDWDEATDKTSYKLLKKVKAPAPKG